MAEPWFDENTSGVLYGAIVGGGLGLVGSLAGVLAPQGKGRSLVLGLMWLMVAVGGSQLAFGLYALAAGQPFHNWFWACGAGVVVIPLVGGLIPDVRRRYAEAEARRVEAKTFRRH